MDVTRLAQNNTAGWGEEHIQNDPSPIVLITFNMNSELIQYRVAIKSNE